MLYPCQRCLCCCTPVSDTPHTSYTSSSLPFLLPSASNLQPPPVLERLRFRSARHLQGEGSIENDHCNRASVLHGGDREHCLAGADAQLDSEELLHLALIVSSPAEGAWHSVCVS